MSVKDEKFLGKRVKITRSWLTDYVDALLNEQRSIEDIPDGVYPSEADRRAIHRDFVECLGITNDIMRVLNTENVTLMWMNVELTKLYVEAVNSTQKRLGGSRGVIVLEAIRLMRGGDPLL